MNLQDFYRKYNGRRLDYDGGYGAQCVDLIKAYFAEVVGTPPIGGNAIDYWERYPRDRFDRIVNTITAVPRQGDIIIWGKGLNPYGHIAIFDRGNVWSFVSFDQNFPVGTGCHFQSHNYRSVLGWLRPKVAAPAPAPLPSDAFQVVISRKLATYRISGRPEVYQIFHIPNPEFFEKLGNKWEDIRELPADFPLRPEEWPNYNK